MRAVHGNPGRWTVLEAGRYDTVLMSSMLRLLGPVRTGSKALSLVAAAYYLSALAWATASRIRYPFALEWMEGGMVDHVRRVLAGAPLYGEPTLEFTPFIYPPLYTWVSAAASTVMGVSFSTLRGVSLTATVGCLLLIYSYVRRETGSMAAPLLAAGLFASTFALNGRWFDLARVDSLFLLLVLWGAYTLRFHGRRGSVAAGVLFALAFLTKQTALPIALVLIGRDLLVRRGRKRWLFGAVFATLAGGSVLLLNWLTDGYFYYYIFELPQGHRLVEGELLRFWTRDMLQPLGIAWGVILLVLWRTRRPKDGAPWFLVAFLVGMVGTAWMSRFHTASFVNVLMPAHAAISIGAAIGFHHLFLASRERDKSRWHHLQAAIVGIACVAQFALLARDPRHTVPRPEDAQAGRAFLERLAEIEGPILLTSRGYILSRIGKDTWAHDMALRDVLRSHRTQRRKELEQSIRTRIRSGEFGAILLDSERSWFQADVLSRYELVESPLEAANGFWPRSGYRTRPHLLYLPKSGDP